MALAKPEPPREPSVRTLPRCHWRQRRRRHTAPDLGLQRNRAPSLVPAVVFHIANARLAGTNASVSDCWRNHGSDCCQLIYGHLDFVVEVLEHTISIWGLEALLSDSR